MKHGRHSIETLACCAGIGALVLLVALASLCTLPSDNESSCATEPPQLCVGHTVAALQESSVPVTDASVVVLAVLPPAPSVPAADVPAEDTPRNEHPPETRLRV